MRKIIFLVLLALTYTSTYAQTLSSYWEKGDEAYKKEDYTTAQQQYEKAEKGEGKNPALDYNSGNAYFQQQKTEEARKNWDKALEESKDKNLSADALHNIGNSYLAEKKYKEAIDAYQKSLRHRPNDEATKKNLQIAKKQLQQQQQQQQNKDQQDQQQQQQNKDNKQQEQQQGQNKNDNSQKDKKESEQQPSEQPIELQNAERLLKMLEQEEQKVQKKVKEQQGTKAKHSGKDW